jgi:hypothetical protein
MTRFAIDALAALLVITPSYDPRKDGLAIGW